MRCLASAACSASATITTRCSWQALKYDTNLGGYVTGITQDQLRGAPKYADESSWNWSDPATARSVNAYYGVPVA